MALIRGCASWIVLILVCASAYENSIVSSSDDTPADDTDDTDSVIKESADPGSGNTVVTGGHVVLSGSSTLTTYTTPSPRKQCHVVVAVRSWQLNGTQPMDIFVSYNNSDNTIPIKPNAYINTTDIYGICPNADTLCSNTGLNLATKMCDRVCKEWEKTTWNSSCNNSPCHMVFCNATCHKQCIYSTVTDHPCNCTGSPMAAASNTSISSPMATASDTSISSPMAAASNTSISSPMVPTSASSVSHSELCETVINLCGVELFVANGTDGKARCLTCCNTQRNVLDHQLNGTGCNTTTKTNYKCNCTGSTSTTVRIPSGSEFTETLPFSTVTIGGKNTSTEVTRKIPLSTEKTVGTHTSREVTGMMPLSIESTGAENSTRTDNGKSSVNIIYISVSVSIVVVVVVVIGVVVIKRKRICGHTKTNINMQRTNYKFGQSTNGTISVLQNRVSTNVHLYEEIELSSLNEPKTMPTEISNKKTKKKHSDEIRGRNEASDVKHSQIPTNGCNTSSDSIPCQISNNEYEELGDIGTKTIDTMPYTNTEKQYCSLKRVQDRIGPEYEDIQINQRNQISPDLESHVDTMVVGVGNTPLKSDTNNTYRDRRLSTESANTSDNHYFILEKSEATLRMKGNRPYQNEVEDSVKTIHGNDVDKEDTETVDRGMDQISSDQTYYILEKNDTAHLSEDQCIHRPIATDKAVHGVTNEPEYFVLEKSNDGNTRQEQYVHKPILAEKGINAMPNDPEYFVLEKSNSGNSSHEQCFRKPVLVEKDINGIPNDPEYSVVMKKPAVLSGTQQQATLSGAQQPMKDDKELSKEDKELSIEGKEFSFRPDEQQYYVLEECETEKHKSYIC